MNITRKKKTRRRNVYLSGLVILAVFFLLFIWAGLISRPFNGKADRITKSLYSDDQDVNDVDVALIGGSHAANGFNPSALYRDYGIQSYNYSYSGSPLYLNYYYLKELYKKHNFKVVVVDLCYAGVKDDYFSKDEYVFEVVSNMRWSLDKVQFIEDHILPENKLQYYFPAFRYHSRLTELTKDDILRQPIADNDYLLGGDYHKEIYAEETGIVHFDPWDDTKECSELPSMVKTYLEKIIELTKEHGSKLLFTVLPYSYNKSGVPVAWVENEYTNYNSIRRIADENDIPMIQFDGTLQKELGFVPEKHMFNPGHMNVYGSELIASYLGKYICEHFDIEKSAPGSNPLLDSYLSKYTDWLGKESDQ